VDRGAARERLVDLLRMAFSGERAAALAYGGHARSVRDPAEAARIRIIEAEELHHRDLVGGMLRDLGSGPDPRRERRAERVGRVLAFLCGWTGWLAPMWGAGRLERRNIVEYEDAARLAVAAGRPEFVDCLLAMAEVEWDHEAFFRGRVLAHPLAFLVPVWSAPPPREAIRASFAAATAGPAAALPAPA
jgi:hypothetical protein